jgi:glycosyltransferase involved in cell wall biosynthesis
MSTPVTEKSTRKPIGYLVAEYPAPSHTFIAREIDALREAGVDVETMSIRKTPERRLLTVADRRAAAETFSVLPVPMARLLRSHAVALAMRPAAYLRTLRTALRLTGGGPRATLWQLFYFGEAIIVWAYCRGRGITHIHVHFANVASAVALLAADFGRDDGLRWSFTMHGPTEFDDVTKFRLAEKVRDAQFVACISDYCRSQLLKLVDPRHWGKLAIVRCGLDADAARGDVPLKDPVGGDASLRVLCVGRLVPEKGQFILLQALAELHRRGVDASATIVGDGPDRAALENATQRVGISDRVEFTGALGADHVAQLYRQADVFCLPSFAEGVPVVLMEAMSNRLPVVTTRIAGIPELVEDGVSGALLAPGQVAPIADALERLAEEPKLRQRWGEAGRERVLEAYDIREAARRLAALFAE